MKLHMDYETFSECDLRALGGYHYAQDLSTGIYTLGYAFDDEPVEVWVPGYGKPFPARIIEHIFAGGEIHAWNAQFERLITWYVLCTDFDIPEPALEQFRCSAAQARAHGMPGKLDDCARALGVSAKDPEGDRLIRTYSANAVPWNQIPEEDQRAWIEYCRRDVEVERALARCFRELTPGEWDEYHINERINDRGVPVDTEMAEMALEYANEVRDEVDDKIRRLTRGAIQNANARTSRDQWILPQLTEDQVKLITKKNGKLSFDEEHRQALALAPGLPEPVGRYLALREEAGGATISKYSGLWRRAIDGRVRGALMWNGAGQTGRFSSTGIQLHNLRRDGFEDPEPLIRDLKARYHLPDVTDTLARLVRSCIHSEQGLSWFDFSAIEGRVAPWLADSALGELKLDLFRAGIDTYITTAADTFGVTPTKVTKQQRQVGKVQELALQFLGGVGALQAMGRNYGMHIDEDWGQYLVDVWRQRNPWARKFGDELDAAAFAAVIRPGSWQAAGRISYVCDDDVNWLWCRLPSGRLLAYNKPRIEDVETPWGDTRMAVTCVWGAAKPKVGEEWPRRAMHGGLWIENTTQAVAADLLREAIVRGQDLPIVLHVHDEMVVEGYCEDRLEEVMLTPPPWAGGLPLAGEGGSGTRYGK